MCCMLTLAILMMFQAAAEGAPYPADPPCSDGGTFGMAQCLEQQASRWDARLKSEYEAAQGRLPIRRRMLLQAAQRDWIRYRFANCKLYASHEGTVRQLLSNGCERDMAKARTLELYKLDRAYVRFPPTWATVRISADDHCGYS
ncbi:lysozyme inhibitor LprI family protein [Sphingomonas sp. Tas61C01]|uniref:lysozyme inhibitor LprI family protein n=1 Tax=Sphingomonas sp. Tas61C01 TaxID=3458297 RepID=UPI00403EC11A